MPSRRSADGEFRDIAHPINTATRDHLQAVVLDAYKKSGDAE
jgi:stage V sporulation protein G